MKKKGFTLVELLVVIAIIAMLLAILMPALGKARQLAYRLMCGTNESGIGKAMMIYSNDYDEEFPIAGGKGVENTWATEGNASFDWSDAEYDWDNQDNSVTISASLFLLIKYADVSAKQFICQASDQKDFEYDPDDGTGTQPAEDMTECWDFGDDPWDYCSYSYQMPYGTYVPSVSSPAGAAVIADRSPYYDSQVPSGDTDLSDFDGITDVASLDTSSEMKKGNSRVHQQEGQNVLYGDIHVKFEKTPNVGIQQDNIYTVWSTISSPSEIDIQIGDRPGTVGTDADTAGGDSEDTDDSFLASDEDMG